MRGYKATTEGYCEHHHLTKERVLGLLSQGKQLRDLLRASGVNSGCGPCSQLLWGLELTNEAGKGKTPRAPIEAIEEDLTDFGERMERRKRPRLKKVG